MCRSGWRKPDHRSVSIFKSEWLLYSGTSSALWKAYLEFTPPLHISSARRLTLSLLPCPVIPKAVSHRTKGAAPLALRGWGMWASFAEDGGRCSRGGIVNGFFCLRPKKSINRLRAGPVWPSCIFGDASIDSGDRAEFIEQVSKDLIWENVRNEPKQGLSVPYSLWDHKKTFSLSISCTSMDHGLFMIFLELLLASQY